MTHEEIIVDYDPCFEIDYQTRAISNTSSTKMTIMQYDHNSERFTFSMARYIEGHDMSECDRVEVHYKIKSTSNNNTYIGVYEISDMTIDPEDETKVIFTWLLSQNVTEYVGPLAFLIRFACLNDEGDELDYVWNTAVFSGISVSQDMYNGDAVIQPYADILEQWKTELWGIANHHPIPGDNGNCLDYKVVWKGRDLIIAPKNYASSQLCSCCGYKNKDVKKLNLREWDCPECNSHHDRDVNVSINLLKLAI